MPAAVYIEDMFQTGNDAANRATVKRYETAALPLVGLGFREERKLVDKITKGAKLHSRSIQSPMRSATSAKPSSCMM